MVLADPGKLGVTKGEGEVFESYNDVVLMNRGRN